MTSLQWCSFLRPFTVHRYLAIFLVHFMTLSSMIKQYKFNKDILMQPYRYVLSTRPAFSQILSAFLRTFLRRFKKKSTRTVFKVGYHLKKGGWSSIKHVNVCDKFPRWINFGLGLLGQFHEMDWKTHHIPVHPQHYYVFHVDSRKEFERQALQRMIEERFTRHQIDTQVSGFLNPQNIWSQKVQAQKIWIAIAAHTKGQLISKADWRAIDSPKKRMDKFVLFAFSLFTTNKSNSSVRFLG